jgi:hypothetical protein
MMKKIRHKLIAVLVGVVAVSTSCVQDDNFEQPNLKSSDPVVPRGNFTTFKAIRSLFEQAVNEGRQTVVIDNDIYIEGYVISSDKAGNFFETLVIQNKIDAHNPDEDPRLGFKINIDQRNLSDTYQIGQKVIVQLQGLTVGESSGVLTIGRGDAVHITQIQASEYRTIVKRTPNIATLIPKRVRLEDLTEADENTLIQLDAMQFNRFELGATYASESFDKFDGLRVLESCDSGIQMVLKTSTFSDFKALPVPQGNGSIVGVYGRDFRDDFNVLVVNTITALKFEDETRCDPLEFTCNATLEKGNMNLVFEDFETQRNNKIIAIEGWTNYIEKGSQGWEGWSSTATNASLGRSARFQSASSGDVSNVGWLITPQIDLDAQDGETLSFSTSSSRADSSYMEVFFAKDWDGTATGVTTARWQILTDAYIVKDTDAFVPWFSSGLINLSCITGRIHIAFKYTGGGQDSFDGVYELDNISVDFKN